MAGNRRYQARTTFGRFLEGEQPALLLYPLAHTDKSQAARLVTADLRGSSAVLDDKGDEIALCGERYSGFAYTRMLYNVAQSFLGDPVQAEGSLWR
jgi:hypothetical protein